MKVICLKVTKLAAGKGSPPSGPEGISPLGADSWALKLLHALLGTSRTDDRQQV